MNRFPVTVLFPEHRDTEQTHSDCPGKSEHEDVLDRAQVGRSTFYVHYRDKQYLFLSDVEDFLASFSTVLDRQDPSSKRLHRLAWRGLSAPSTTARTKKSLRRERGITR
jgi:AcrR family transcriptional regulator